MPDAPRIWIDASGILNWTAPRVSGIQRVEAALLLEALSADERQIGIAAYSQLTNEWRPLTPENRSFLKAAIDATLNGAAQERSSSSLRLKLDHFARWQTRKLRYEIAAAITGRQSGPAFQMAKGLLRISLNISKPFVRTAATIRRWTNTSHCVLANPGDVLLLSYSGPIKEQQKRAITRRKAHLCHVFYDLIPIDHPEWYSHILNDDFVGYVQTIVRQHGRIFAISEYSRDRLSDWCREQGFPRPDVAACPLGDFISQPRLPDRELKDVPELAGKRFAVYCSTIDPRKNHITLVRAWERLAREIGSGNLPHLAFLGHYGWLYDDVKQAIEESPVSDLIHVIPDLADEQLAWAYRNALFGFFPSIVEGWGLGVSECLTNGLPVLISDAASLNEAAQGLMPVIPARNVDAWSGEIRGLLEDPDALAQLRKRAGRYQPRTGKEYAGEIFAGMQELISES